MAVGRISGPLLKANLLRDGVDLAFETSLLYLDVNNSRIGINTSSPDYDLDVNGYIRTTNLEVTGQINIDPLTISGNTISSSDGTLNLSPATGGVVYQGTIDVGNIEISDNTIYTLNGNTLEIRPNGIGTTQIYSNTKVWGDLDVTGNINVQGDITIGGNLSLINQSSGSINFAAGIASDIDPTDDNLYNLGTSLLSWKNLYAYNMYVGNVSINSGTISTVNPDTDLTILGNGSGSVNIEDLSINDNTISATGDIKLSPIGSGNVVINSTQSIQIASGTTLQRPNPASAGMIRFNTSYGHYEGYNGSNWIAIDGVYDVDRNTYITAELNPGVNDNTIRFYTNGDLSADLDSTRFSVNSIEAGDISITANTISTITTDADLYLSPDGSGKVIIDSLEISGSTIHNSTSNGVTVLSNDGAGYLEITGNYGFVMPVGNNANRITSGSNPVGLTRYNTDDKRAEIWDGFTWTSVAGTGAGVSQADADTIAIISVFTFG